jgi:DNA-directed RNA polymerase subunit RPC12/RpoP
MNSLSPTKPSKLTVWLAALGVGIGWFFMVVMMLVFVSASVGVAAGKLPMRFSVSPLIARSFLACVGFFISCSFIYLLIALKLRCPHCAFKFLKNPKGLGPTGFVYHASCPKKAGLNPWAVQIGRFLAIHKIRCINCGREVFE